MTCTCVDIRRTWILFAFLCLSFLPGVLKAGGITAGQPKQERPLVITLGFNLSNYNGVNVSCAGSVDGSIDLTPSGGIAPYTYIWSNGATTEDLTALPAGTYTVTVTDFTGDTETGAVTLNAPSPLGTVLVSTLPDSCGGIGNGLINITTAGGIPGYNWQWSNGSNTEDVGALVTGSYTVKVTDLNGCVVINTYPVAQVAAMQLTQIVSNVKCSGAADGSIDITVISGNPAYTYAWSNGATVQDISAIGAGSYTVTVTDAAACSISSSFTVVQPATLPGVAVNSSTNILCNGQATGAVNITASGGTPGYSYLWSTGSTLEDISDLAAGTYTVTVTDANGCTASLNRTLTQNAALVLSSTVTNVNCNGLLTGAVNLTVSGGVPGYSYSWSNGNTSEDLVGVGASVYTVTVTDAALCTAIRTVTVSQPAALSLSTSVTQVSCNGGSSGFIDLTVAGGTAGYTYLWNNGTTTQDRSGLTAGTYTVTVTDANACTAVTSVIVSQPAALSLSTNVTNVACSGGNNGAVNLTVSGGTAGYTYNWSSGSTTEDLSGLAAGTYTVTVTDALNCTSTTTATVGQSGSLAINFFPVNGTCNAANGSVTALVSGGTPAYNYLWSTGAATPVLSGLAAGTYTLTVTDAALCTITNSLTIGNSGSPQPAVNQLTSVSCNGGSNGAVDINVTSGTPGYTYLWSTGAITQDISGVPAGTYTVTVTDVNFCVGIQSFVVTQPLVVGGTAVVAGAACNGGASGSIDLTPSGGTPGYSYLWNNGAVTQDRTGLIAGSYTVTITDVNACTAVRTFTVTQPTPVAVTTSSTPTGCLLSTGSVSAVASGGAPGYSYLWSSGGTSATVNGLASGIYTVTVTDANGCTALGQASVVSSNGPVISAALVTNVTCNGGANGAVDISVSGGTPAYAYNWSNGAISQDLTALPAGNYTVTVTDANNCSVNGSYTVAAPAAVSATAVVTNISCNGGSNGSIDITPSGGNGVFTYVWSNGAISQDITSLTAGSYTVTLTDGNGCTGSALNAVTQPAAISTVFSVTNLSCNGVSAGSINLTVSGGTPAFGYLWSNGFSGEDPSGLAAGTYTVTITDANGCTAVRNSAVTQPPVISAAVATTPAACGTANGTAIVTAAGGTGLLSLLWSNGQTTAAISNLSSGIYTVTVTDANNCSRQATGTVASSSGPVISNAVIDNVNCAGGNDGGVDITPGNGTAPLTYAWSNGATTQDVSGISAGTYSVTVTDANSCTVTGQYQVIEPLALAASFSQTPASCSLANGSIAVVPSGGTPGYTYLWSNGSSVNPVTNVPAAVYTVTVTDQQGCTGAFTSSVSGTAATVLDSSRVQNAVCNATATGTITLFLSGGTPPLAFLWSTGATTQNLTGLTNGNYTVTITNGSGCTLTSSFVVTQPTFLSATTSTLPSFCGQFTGSATVTAGGGTPAYTYLWSNGGTTAVISNLTAGTYTVTVTDANGCTRRRNAVVSLTNGPVITLTSLTNVSCYGGSNGAVDIAVTGGTTPYAYNWSNGAVTQDISGLSAGSYTVIVTDSTLCSDSLSFTVAQPDSFSVSSTITAAACGLSNGSIVVGVSGGTPAYSYQWSTGSTTSNSSGLSPATYTLTISDGAGCNGVYQFAVGAQNGPVVVVDSVRNLSCFGVNNGRIYISVAGGSAPVSYLWNDGNTGSNRFGLAAGTYTVTVTDGGGCTAQISTSITSNSQLQLNFSATQASCGQANGSASVVPAGGTAPYTLEWETGSIAGTIGGLAAGFYSITITDALGCTRIDSVAVTNSGSPLVTLQNQVPPACFGGSNGSLNIGISGGTPPYAILWSNGAVSALNNNLAAGSYAVTVTDSAGCIELASFTLAQPDSLQLQFIVTRPYCGQGNGVLNAAVLGGTGQVQYLWSTGATSAGLTAIAAGLFTVTVTDQNNCARQDTIRVSDILGPALTLDSLSAVSCFGGSNGSILVSASGGTAPLGYSWSSGQVTPAVSGIAAGTYTLVVTDSAGCTDTLSVALNQPAALVVQSSVTDAACNNPNGTIQLTVSGGIGGYSYLWSTGATTGLIHNLLAGTYTVTVTDGNSCTIQQVIAVSNLNGPVLVPASMSPVSCPGGSDGQLDITVQFGAAPFTYLWSNGQTTQDVSGLSAGIYTLTVTDLNNCISIISDTVTEPAAIGISAVITDASCNTANGIIVVQSTGGTPGYTYQWSNGQGSSTLTGLAAGSYTVTATDAAGCSHDTVFAITNTGVPQLVLDQIDSVSCFGLADGAIDISVSGGVAPYLYTWINTPQTTQDVNGLVAGSYSVIVTDNRGCTNSQLYNVGQPTAIQFNFPVLQNAACGQANGAAAVQATGGIPGYLYQWSNGVANDSITGIPAGSYTVTITDARGCSRSAIANISNINGPTITDVDSAGVTCYGDNNGFISITATGASLPLTYAWTGLPSVTPTIAGLTAGFYTVTVTDAAGCLLVRTINITQPDSFTINAVIPQNNPPFNVSCNGLSDGSLNLSVTGGNPSYAFIWNNGAVSQNLNNIPAGTFTVLITDVKGCTATRSFALTEPPVLEANAGDDVIICGESLVKLNANNPAFGNGAWQVVSSSGVILFSNASSPLSEVSGMGEGDNVLRWIISNGICSDTDLVVITKTSAIDAVVGVTKRICGETVTLNATRPEFGYGYWTPVNPQVTLEDSAKAFTAAYGLGYGNNQFIWTVVNGTCRDSALLTIFRKDTLDCLEKIKMPTAFSPNFDGFNDFLIIKGLEDFPDNTIELYNRWGQLVYSKESYRNDWYGLDPEGVPLPDGTYFVILKVRFINKVYNTYIDMRR